jgi:hypothetical protein
MYNHHLTISNSEKCTPIFNIKEISAILGMLNSKYEVQLKENNYLLREFKRK